MAFHRIAVEHWARKEHYEHFMQEVVCSYSMTADLDITRLKGQRLYPAMLWLLTDTVQAIPEFRTAATEEGLGVYDGMTPAYTVFHQQTKTFSCLWTAFSEDYPTFLKAYEADLEAYGTDVHYIAKPGRPANSFDVSVLPWACFTGFHLNIAGDGKYLLPIFTIGRKFERDGRLYLPLAIQVHHAVCDGYHICLFVNTLQEKIERFPACGRQADGSAGGGQR
ncbi:MAG: CatA-like O-acetyltransferase [Christensenellaceae bacterium]